MLPEPIIRVHGIDLSPENLVSSRVWIKWSHFKWTWNICRISYFWKLFCIPLSIPGTPVKYIKNVSNFVCTDLCIFFTENYFLVQWNCHFFKLSKNLKTENLMDFIIKKYYIYTHSPVLTKYDSMGTPITSLLTFTAKYWSSHDTSLGQFISMYEGSYVMYNLVVRWAICF